MKIMKAFMLLVIAGGMAVQFAAFAEGVIRVLH